MRPWLIFFRMPRHEPRLLPRKMCKDSDLLPWEGQVHTGSERELFYFLPLSSLSWTYTERSQYHYTFYLTYALLFNPVTTHWFNAFIIITSEMKKLKFAKVKFYFLGKEKVPNQKWTFKEQWWLIFHMDYHIVFS